MSQSAVSPKPSGTPWRSRLVLVLLAAVPLTGFGLLWWTAVAGDTSTQEPTSTKALENLLAGPPVEEQPETLAMPEEEAKYLQDAEHLGGFVLGDRSFPQIANALRDADVEALTAFFDEDFTGKVFSADSGHDVTLPFASLRIWKEKTATLVARDRDQFVQELLSYRNEFKELGSASLKVMLMSPEEEGNLAGPWHGSFKFTLNGVTHDGELAERMIKFHCRVKQITDDTPDERGWMTACDAYKSRYSRGSQPLMRDMTAETGIDIDALHDNWDRPDAANIPFLTGGVYTCDYNHDGHVDMLLTDLNGLFFYEGRSGGRFVDATTQVGLPRVLRLDNPSVGGAFGDLDDDGWEDLIVGSVVFRNEEGKRFSRLGPDDTTLRLDIDANQLAVADYDRDGDVDIYEIGIIDEQASGHAWIGETHVNTNKLWRNDGDWQFVDVTEETGTKGNGSPAFAAVWFDANGDDWPDLMTACEAGQNDYFINQKDGTFRNHELPGGYGGFSMGLTVADLDNDGFGDPYVGNMYSKAGERIVGNLRRGVYDADTDSKMRDFVKGNELYHNLGDGHFERRGEAAEVNDVGWAYGPAYGDLNNDGFPDLYSTVGFQSISRDKPDG